MRARRQCHFLPTACVPLCGRVLVFVGVGASPSRWPHALESCRARRLDTAAPAWPWPLCWAGPGRQKRIKHSPSFKIPTVPWESQPVGLSSLCSGISALEARRTRFRVWLRTTCGAKSRRGPGFRLPGKRMVPSQGEEPHSERKGSSVVWGSVKLTPCLWDIRG